MHIKTPDDDDTVDAGRNTPQDGEKRAQEIQEKLKIQEQLGEVQ